MLGLFIASLGLSTAVAGSTLLAPPAAVHSGATPAVRNLRYWTIYLAMLGLIGAPLTLMELAAPLPLGISVAASAVLAHLLGAFFRDTSADIGLAKLVGTEGRVLLPGGAAPGKVVVHTLADRIELPARSSHGGRIERGGKVLIAFIENGVADVVDVDQA